jgi:transposase InsO family protein
MGCRKIHSKLVVQMSEGNYIGRDRFFALLQRQGLLIKRRRNYCRTTNSRHGFQTYHNLLKDMTVTGPNQAWVSDITYIGTHEGNLYLSLVTDVFSRKVVGYDVNDTLEAVGCERTLRMAMRQLCEGEHPIHHSDRGLQYCSKAYVQQLQSKGLPISMTEENHCYENAQAERMNGILKHEYLLKEKFRDKHTARMACKQAISLYNTDRPHLALNMRTPEDVHREHRITGSYPASPIGIRGEMCQLLTRT